MARRLVSTVVRMRGGATLGFGARVRIYDDAALSVLSTIYRRATGVGTQPNPLLPNAGRQTALTVNGAAIDTTITVASTAGFQIGDLIPLRDGTNAVYRVITNINPGTGVITLDSALGFAFLASNTTVGAPEMRGHIWGWLETVLDPFAEIEDIASGRRSPPLQIQISLPGAVVSVMEESGALGQFSVLNFLGSPVTAVDAGAGQLNVTVRGYFSDAMPVGGLVGKGLEVGMAGSVALFQAYDRTAGTYIGFNIDALLIQLRPGGAAGVVVGAGYMSVGATPATAGVIRIPNNQAITARNATNTADLKLLSNSAANGIEIGDSSIATPVIAMNAAALKLPGYSNAAAAGHIRLPTSPTISNRNADNTADEQIWPLARAEIALAADVTMVTPGTYYDILSLSLSPGTWLINASVHFTGISSAGHVAMKLWDGTTVESSGQGGAGFAYSSSMEWQIALCGIITIAATTTWKVSAASSIANSWAAAATLNFGSGNNASRMVAVRIGN